jgi:hypothetical protein
LHDREIFFRIIVGLGTVKNFNNFCYSRFWVGLMDGDGSIQVNHWRCKLLQFRFIIKLKNTTANVRMLNELQKKLGIGNVCISKDRVWVLWVENHQSKILKLLRILEKYPPLTSRLTMQLTFFKKMYYSKNVQVYFATRDSKYKDLEVVQQNFVRTNIVTLPYFCRWFSGFVEAEGCFSVRKNGNKSFSIGQKNDMY